MGNVVQVVLVLGQGSLAPQVAQRFEWSVVVPSILQAKDMCTYHVQVSWM